MLMTYGIQTQTPHEVEPVQIWSSSQMIKIFQQLGVNEKIGLSGRPPRPVGSLGTSKLYRVCGSTIMCYPLIFEVSDFYLYRDMALLIDDIKTELQFVGKYWRLSGRPTVCLLIKEEHMRDPQFKEMLDLLAMLKKGFCDGMKVRIGRLQNLISSSCMEHLDFVSDIPEFCENSFIQIHHEYIGYQSLTDVPKALAYNENKIDCTSFQAKPVAEIIGALRGTESIFCRCQLYGILIQREGPHYEVRKFATITAWLGAYLSFFQDQRHFNPRSDHRTLLQIWNLAVLARRSLLFIALAQNCRLYQPFHYNGSCQWKTGEMEAHTSLCWLY